MFSLYNAFHYVSQTTYSSQLQLETVQVLPPPKDMDPATMSWKGGAVVARLEGTRDAWVGRKEWLHCGLESIKDRSMFMWV